ncbi:hypothetical protein PFICI_06792 [Pestalotiopsis fici W106-1]|uniref:Uncharacterized protein n=1 Tax=Pestalotiopsis fici (strain W106-1 / CGMCC3.15140) TaxID=1229662 RepID=W3X6W7_PESFW|nr:uncharacterized protein PFICI_06792 [Pestalotiopsis fici W106-1]ETS81790.1 hypothetical protein PFICI_06792 [Pestalotiopsis fici W106-1]
MDVELGPSSQSQPGFYHGRDFDQGPSAYHAGAGAANGAALGSFQANSIPTEQAPAANDQPPVHYSWAPAQTAPATSITVDDEHTTSTRKMRKRKAETQDNERLSKRLSLLNLEKDGQKLYVPVESPQLRPTAGGSSSSAALEGDQMQLDESKHKVYIYDLDAELADEGSESSSDEAKLVFLPDIAKHLRQQSRIPPRVLANPDGELAGMQLVLYSEPKSLTVPESQDSVRKAIADARARLRSKHQQPHTGAGTGSNNGVVDNDMVTAAPSMDIEISSPAQERRIPNGLNNLANDATETTNGMTGPNNYSIYSSSYDPDAMDMDID